MENTATISLGEYNRLVKYKNDLTNISEAFHRQYSYVCLNKDGYCIYSKEDYAIQSRLQYNKMQNELTEKIDLHLKRIEDFNNIPWYKRIFKTV